MCLVLAGCGFGPPIEAAAVPRAPGAPGDTVLRLAHPYDAGHPVERCGTPAIQEELLGSGITVESYPSAQLGNEAESLEQVAAGGLDIAVAGPSFLGVWHEPAAVLDGAYLFDGPEDFTRAVQGSLVADVHEQFRERSGMRVLSTWYYGTRHTTSGRPVGSPADLAGMKIRTPDAPQYLTNIALMGGSPTPMALDEVYLALQQGTLDAQENPIPTIDSAGFAEVQGYLNLTAHLVQGIHPVINDRIHDALEPAQRERLDRATDRARDAVRTCIEQEEREILAGWRADGPLVVNDVDTEAFARQVRAELPSRVSWGDLYTRLAEDR